MGRDPLKGRDGDRISAVLAATGYNFSLLRRWFERLLRVVWASEGARLGLSHTSTRAFEIMSGVPTGTEKSTRSPSPAGVGRAGQFGLAALARPAIFGLMADIHATEELAHLRDFFAQLEDGRLRLERGGTNVTKAEIAILRREIALLEIILARLEKRGVFVTNRPTPYALPQSGGGPTPCGRIERGIPAQNCSRDSSTASPLPPPRLAAPRDVRI